MMADRLGQRLGSWAWVATRATAGMLIAGVRMLLVAAFLALVWHALVPDMPFGAWMIIFFTVNLVAWPCKHIGRALCRASLAYRKGSGFARRSRVVPPP
jgi:fatty acid desaturase